MSRRKQPKPRHLEAENDLAALLEDEPCVYSLTEAQCNKQSESLQVERSTSADYDDGTQPRSPASPAIGDAHVCGKCRAEFFDLSEFLTHKKNCSQKRIVVMYDDKDGGNNNNNGESIENDDNDEIDDDDVVATALRTAQQHHPQPTSPKSLVNGEDLGDDLIDDDVVMDHKVGESGASIAGDDSLDAMAALEKADFGDNKSDLGSNDGDDLDSPVMDGDEDDLDDAMDEGEESMDMDVKFNLAKEMASSKDLLVPLLHKQDLPQMFPFGFPGFPGMPPLPGLPGVPAAGAAAGLFPDSNVKLASLQGTKVAMAQFAENNLANLPPNTDVATLQTMLFSLHQQQILQLQLLQQLQQQLMDGMAPSVAASFHAQALGHHLLPPTTPTLGAAVPAHIAAHLPQSSSSLPTSGSSSIPAGSQHLTPTSTTTEALSGKPSTQSSTASIGNSSGSKTSPTLPHQQGPRSSEPSSTSSSLPPTPPFDLPPSASKSVMNAMTEATSRILMSMTPKEMPTPNFSKEGKMARPPSPLPPTPSRSPSRPVKEAGTILDRSQYAADDPFFKHKCRFCHKVFGSDSGLQIHIRSHTGERPFKCNICGNRFSTRGNLKVHFSRHKDKYPHVKMNPHPVPEHLDRLTNPILVAPMPAMMERDPMMPPSLMPAEKKPRLELPPGAAAALERHQGPGSAENSNSSSAGSVPPSHQYQRSSSAPGVGGGDHHHRLAVTSPASSTGGNSHGASSAVHSPTPAASEAPARSSPNVSDTAAMSTSVSSLNMMAHIAEAKIETSTKTTTASSTSSISSAPSQRPGSSPGHASKPMLPMGSPPGTPGGAGSNTMMLSPHPAMSVPPTSGQMMPGVSVMSPGMPPFGMLPESPFFVPPSILPSKEEDPMEQYMECNKSETTKLEQLVQNLETKLTDPNQCAICHRILSCKSALQMHYRTHTGERPFKCKICGRAFTTKGNLKTHMGVHRAKPPMRMLHQCPVCHKQFTNALVLQQHIRMHTGEISKDAAAAAAVAGMPSLMPVPVSVGEMMPGAPYMPFPAFPFMAPMYPPPPGSHPLQNNQGHSSSSRSDRSDSVNSGDQVGNSGELDLRKPTNMKKSSHHSGEDGTNSEAGSEKKDSGSMHGDHDKMMDVQGSEDNISSAGSSNNEAFGMDAAEMLAAEKAEKVGDLDDDDVDMDTESHHNERPPRSPTADSVERNHDAPSRSSLMSETDLKSEQGGHISPFSSTSTTPTPTPPASKTNGDFKPPNDYLSLFSTPSSYLPPSTSSYSTSLMALEERVKAIEAPSTHYNFNSQRPLEQMASIVRRQEGQVTPPGGAGSSHSHSPGAASQPDLDSGNASPASSVQKDGASFGGSVSPSSSQTSQGNLNSNSPFYPSKMDRDSALFGLPPVMGMSPYKGFGPGALDLTPRPFSSGRPHTSCNICYKTFACKSALDIHYRSHTKDRPFKCEVCERSFSTRGNMKQHMLTHKIRDLPSEAFNKSPASDNGQPPSANPSSPSRPRSDPGTPPTTPIKGDDADLKPTLPPIAASPSDAAKSSITSPPGSGGSSSGGAPPPQQNSSSTSSSSSSTNNSSSNLDSPFVRRNNLKHVCQMCHKPFSSASALQIHIRTHTGDKPFKCTICGKAFTTKGNLKVHMGTHMWNNSPSRRGRRMSMDALPHGFPSVHPTGVPPPRPDVEFFNNFPPHHRPVGPGHPPPHPGAEMYPFFPGFPNGFSPKMNEISVIQSLNGNMGHMPGHPPVPPTPEGLLPASHGRPGPGADGLAAKQSIQPLPESPLKSPTTSSLKSEMKSPDSFLMKAPEPHVIAPHDSHSSPAKIDVPHHHHHPRESDMASPDSKPTAPSVPKAESNNNKPPALNNGTSPSSTSANNSSGELDLSLPHKIPASGTPSPISAPAAVSAHSPLSSPMGATSNSNTSPPGATTPPVGGSAPGVGLSPSLPPPPPMSPLSSPGGLSPGEAASASAAWMWRSSKVCASPAGLERHMKGHGMPPHPEESSPKPLMT